MKNFLKYLSVVISVFCACLPLPSLAEKLTDDVIANQQQAYLGLWQTIDDDTNQPRSLVSIALENGQLSATITKLYTLDGESNDPKCDKCKGELKDAKILGLNILNGMRFRENAWQDGEILDPKNGKFYDAKIWLEDGQLQVRGYIGFFFRTQQWLRVKTE